LHIQFRWRFPRMNRKTRRTRLRRLLPLSSQMDASGSIETNVSQQLYRLV
jgi:hypothetical protein